MEENKADYWNKKSDGRIKARYVSPHCVILHQQGLYPEIGEGTWIGHFTVIDGSQGLTIGRNCSIASGVHIYTHSTHDKVALGKEKHVGNSEIGDNVVIGANSVIHYSCIIEDNAIIGALSMLKPYTIVWPYEFWAGSPAKLVRHLKPQKREVKTRPYTLALYPPIPELPEEVKEAI